MSARKEFEKILFEYTEEATVAGGQAATGSMAFSFIDKDAVKAARANANKLSKETLARLQGDLNETIAQGIAEGKTQLAITKDLDTIFDGMATYQTERIARTEIAAGVSNGHLLGYEQMEVENVELVNNAGACPLCQGVNGQIMTLTEAKGYIPIHPNCYCFWIPRPDLNKKKPKVPIKEPIKAPVKAPIIAKPKPKPKAKPRKMGVNLDDIDQVMHKEFNAWKVSLSPGEINSIQDYVVTTYGSINTALRTGKGMAVVKKDIKLLSSAIKKGTMKQDTIVFRGLGDRSLVKQFNKLQPGMVIEDLGFVSTTLSKKVAGEFLVGEGQDAVMLVLNVKKGTKCGYLNFNSLGGRDEAELLLNAGTKFKVTGTKIINNTKTIYADVAA